MAAMEADAYSRVSHFILAFCSHSFCFALRNTVQWLQRVFDAIRIRGSFRMPRALEFVYQGSVKVVFRTPKSFFFFFDYPSGHFRSCGMGIVNPPSRLLFILVQCLSYLDPSRNGFGPPWSWTLPLTFTVSALVISLPRESSSLIPTQLYH